MRRKERRKKKEWVGERMKENRDEEAEKRIFVKCERWGEMIEY